MEKKLAFEVPRTLMSRSGHGVRSAVLGMPELDVAVFEPVIVRWVYWAVLLVGTVGDWIGVGIVWYFLLRERTAEDPMSQLIAKGIIGLLLVSSLVAAGIAVAGLTGRFGPGRIVLDRRARRLWRQRARAGAPLEEEQSLDAVAAVQIGSGTVGGPESPLEVFEINLVLSNPPGERIHLLHHADERELKDDASRLADFLRVPLLDHSRDAR